jgi:hypothetical protein
MIRKRIFISYSTKDKDNVGDLAAQLEMWGYDVFRAHDSIEISKSWRQAILKQIRERPFFIAFLTADFSQSEWTDQEIGIAIATKRKIIGLQLDAKPYGFLADYQVMKYLPGESFAEVLLALTGRGSKAHSQIKAKALGLLERSKNFQEARDNLRVLKALKMTSEEKKNVLSIAEKNNQVAGYRETLNYLSELKLEFPEDKHVSP